MAQGFNVLLTSNTVYDDVARHNENYTSLKSTFSGTSFPTSPEVGQMCWRTDRGQTTTNGTTGKAYQYTGDTTIGENGWIDSETTGFVEAELIASRGSKLTLDQRLDISLNEDGTLKPAATMGSEWAIAAVTFTRVDATTFTTNDNTSDIYLPKRRVKVNSSGTAFSRVVSSSFDGNDTTTVVIEDGVVDSPLESVEHSLISPYQGTAGGALSYYSQDEAAEKNGDASQTFAVASAVSVDDALNKGQLLTEIKAIDGSGSGVDADLLDGLDSNQFLRSDVDASLTGSLIVSTDLTVGGNTVLTGDLTVNGTTTTIDTQNLVVEDKNIELGSVTTPTDITADGGGITLHGDTDKTITWQNTGNWWNFSTNIDVIGNVTLTGTVDGRDVASDGTTVDGLVSGTTKAGDADKLDGNDSTFYLDASNINAGTIGDAYLPATISSDITGNAATATNAGNTDNLDGYTWNTVVNYDISTTNVVQSGRASGGVAMTINDGYGNANLTFNHIGGIPEQDGNAARITVNTDATTGVYVDFQTKSGVTSGTAIALTSILRLYETYATLYGNTIWHAGNDGSGSGLDADTVDGAHLSAIAKTAQTSTTDTVYTDKTTGTNYKMYVDNGALILEEL